MHFKSSVIMENDPAGQGSSHGIFCSSNLTKVFQDFGSINHHNFVFLSFENFLFELLTKLCLMQKEDSNNIILFKNFMKTHLILTFKVTFMAKQ